MIRFISYLITGCWHRWEGLSTAPVFECTDSNRPFAIDHILRCEKCGNLKKKRL